MSSPDEAAALETRPSGGMTLADLDTDHLNHTIVVRDKAGNVVVGELTVFTPLPGDRINLMIKVSGNDFDTSLVFPAGHPMELRDVDGETAVAEPPVDITAVNLDLIRELASVSDRLKANAGEETDLKRRKEELSEQLLGMFEMNGVRSLDVDRRRAYVFTGTYPKYRDRPAEEGGGKYGAADAVKALKAIGRGDAVTPETVNWNTMGSILREYRDAEQDPPPELAAIVELGEKPEVRVGKPR